MEQLVIAVHVLLSIGIIALVMIQQGKGADMGASFGAGASQTLFGSVGSGNVLSHATAILTTLFFATSIGLAFIAKHHAGGSSDAGVPSAAVIQSHNEAAAQPQPAAEVPAVTTDVPAATSTPAGAATGDVPVAPAPASPAADTPAAPEQNKH